MKAMNATAPAAKKAPKNSLHKDNIFKRFWKTRFLFALFVPALVYYIMFKYVPMWGVTLSFYKYNIFKGWAGSPFVGLRNFEVFFNSPSFVSITSNTLVLGIQSLLITFPVTILFSLLLNEIRSLKFKKITQTISYMPHFLSVVVVCSLATSLLDPTQGAINSIIKAFGGKPIYFLMESQWFRPIYLITEVWQGLGWGTIVYLAAIAGIEQDMYEAAMIDGAGKWQQMWHITLSSLRPTIITLFIFRVGGVMNAGFDQIFAMTNALVQSSIDIIDTYVYRVGMESGKFSEATAAGLFKSVIGLVLVLATNYMANKVDPDSAIM